MSDLNPVRSATVLVAACIGDHKVERRPPTSGMASVEDLNMERKRNKENANSKS